MSRRETLFLWTAGGIQRIHKKLKETVLSRSEPDTEPMTDHSERRRYPRVDLSLPIMYKVVGSHYTQLPANVQPYLMADSKNVSPIGVCLDLAEHLPSGAILTLSIHPPDSKESFSAMARVVWSQASETPGHYSTGLQFVVVEGDHVKAEGHTKIETLIRGLAAEERKP